MLRAILRFVTAFVVVALLFPPRSAISQDVGAGGADADPTVIETKLLNGLKVLIVPRPVRPVAIVDVWVGVGSIVESAANSGVSHFFEHMVFKGTPNRPAGQFEQEVDAMGGKANATTSYDWTHYYIEAPSENIDVMIDLLADVTQNAAFPEEEIIREKEVVARERDMGRADSSAAAVRTIYSTLFGDHPYGMPPIGTAESLNNQARADFLAFRDTYYVPNNMTVVIVGDVNPDHALAQVQEKFGAMQPKALPERAFTPMQAVTESQTIELEGDSSQGYLAFAWPGPAIEDHGDVVAMDVLLTLLSGGRSSRFSQNIGRDLGIGASPSAGYFTRHDPSAITVSANFPYSHRATLEAAIMTELESLLRNDVAEAEVERAKTMLLAAMTLSRETNAGLAYELGFYDTVADDYNFTFEYTDRIRSMTGAELVATAQKYIKPDAYVEVVQKPKNWKASATAPVIANNVYSETLPNGLQLVLAEDRSTDAVALFAFVQAGNAAETGSQAGISNLTQRMLVAGTKTLDDNAIFTEMEDLGVNLNQFTTPDAGVLSFVATKDTWDEALPIFVDVLQNPAFDNQEFESVRGGIATSLGKANEDQFALAYQNLRAALYGSGGYGNPQYGDVGALAKLSLGEVKRFYAACYAPEHMVISAVGNFDAELFAAHLRSHLLGMNDGRGACRRQDTTLTLTANKTVEATTAANLTWMMLGYPGPGAGSPDYAAMRVLANILGGSAGSRLSVEVRGQQGLAYSTGAFLPMLAGDSHLVLFAVIQPQQRQRVLQSMAAIIADIQQNGVDAQELERAKSIEVGAFLLDHETASRRAWHQGWFQAIGLGYAQDALYPEQVRAVTADDVRRVAEEYLQHYILSVVKPRQ